MVRVGKIDRVQKPTQWPPEIHAGLAGEFELGEVENGARDFVLLVVAKDEAEVVCLVEEIAEAFEDEHEPKLVFGLREAVFLPVRRHVNLNDPHRKLRGRDERGDIGKQFEPVGEFASFEVRFAVKNFPAMHLGLLREDARAEKVLLDLRERGFVRLEFLVAQDESADEEERAFVFVEFCFTEVEEMHWRIKLMASRLFQKPTVRQPFLEAFDPFAGGFRFWQLMVES